MFVVPISCILIGCFQHMPVIVSDRPFAYFEGVNPKKRKKEKVVPACYVEGVFYERCPNFLP